MEQPFEHEPGSPEAKAQGSTCPPQDGPGAVFAPDGKPGYECYKDCPMHGLEVLSGRSRPGRRGCWTIPTRRTRLSQPDTSGPTADDLRAKVFRDREHSGDWRVEKMDADGGIELALFSGGEARQRAISYADRV